MTTPCRFGRIFSCIAMALIPLVVLQGCGAQTHGVATTDAVATATDDGTTAPHSLDSSKDLPSPDDETDASAASEPLPPGGSAAAGATLSGRVLFDGPLPERRIINMSKDPMCVELHGDTDVLDEALIVSEGGGVINAFVYLRSGLPKDKYPIPAEPYMLDQKNCAYRPRVGGMLVGQKLVVLNSDPVTHNVRSYPIRNRAFNFGQPADSGTRERVFDQPEREVEIQCDIHPWMHAFVFVMDHPFFGVSDEDGKYAIAGLPPGKYTLALWHEKLGKQQQEITIGDSDLADVDFTFNP